MIPTTTIKEYAKQFIQLTPDSKLTFKVPGNEKAAEKVIARIRVFISRIRKKAEAKGIIPKSFKIYTTSLKFDEASDTTTVVLSKVAPNAEIEDEVAEIFKGQTLGGLPNENR